MRQSSRVGRSHRKLKVFFTFIICTTTILAGNKKIPFT